MNHEKISKYNTKDYRYSSVTRSRKISSSNSKSYSAKRASRHDSHHSSSSSRKLSRSSRSRHNRSSSGARNRSTTSSSSRHKHSSSTRHSSTASSLNNYSISNIDNRNQHSRDNAENSASVLSSTSAFVLSSLLLNKGKSNEKRNSTNKHIKSYYRSQLQTSESGSYNVNKAFSGVNKESNLLHYPVISSKHTTLTNEQVTELENKAKDVVNTIVKVDNEFMHLNNGTIVLESLTEYLQSVNRKSTSSIEFAQRVFSHFPFILLSEICKNVNKAIMEHKTTLYGVHVDLLSSLLSFDVISSSLLRSEVFLQKFWVQHDATSYFSDNIKPSYSLLVHVFDSQSGKSKPFFTKDAQLAKNMLFSHASITAPNTQYGHLTYNRNNNCSSVCDNINHFQQNFKAFSHGALQGVTLGDDVFIAGSSIFACLQPTTDEIERKQKRYSAFCKAAYESIPLPTELIHHILTFATSKLKREIHVVAKNHYFDADFCPFWKADIDIFFCGRTQQELIANVIKVGNQICANLSAKKIEYCLMRTSNAITIIGNYPDSRHTQLVMLNHRSVAEFLSFCDLDCTAFAYTGDNIYTVPRGVRAVNTRCNIISPALLKTDKFVSKKNDRVVLTDYQQRVIKYLHRGVSAVTFELCKHQPRCDVTLAPDAANKLYQMCALFCSNLPEEVISSYYKIAKDEVESVATGIAKNQAEDGEPVTSTDSTNESGNDSIAYQKVFMQYGMNSTPHSTARVLSQNQLRLHRRLQREGAPITYKYLFGFAVEDLIVENKTIQDTINAYVDFPCKQVASLATIGLKIARPKRDEILESSIWSWLLPTCYMCNKRHCNSALRDDNYGKKFLSICSSCSLLNKKKRNDKANMSGKVCIVTGGRIKIGYCTALKLLRCGATVVITTRFPRDAANRYKQEADFKQWYKQLHIYGLDLRNTTSVQQFTSHMSKLFPTSKGGIDVLINNAAQTIRRPPAYYTSVFKLEKQLEAKSQTNQLEDDVNSVVKRISNNDVLSLENQDQLRKTITLCCSNSSVAMQLLQHDDSNTSVTPAHHLQLLTDGYCSSASLLSMIPLIESDIISKSEADLLFVEGLTDEHGEQLDLRSDTSWSSTIDKVTPIEMMEVQMVNQIAPFTIISTLSQLMGSNRKLAKDDEQSKISKNSSFIVNVTSTEGQFSSTKYDGVHPHSNMSKAAMNMMTRSISADMRRKLIFVTSVDTGWISQMNPKGTTTKVEIKKLDDTGDNEQKVIEVSEVTNQLEAPLTVEDGAARVLQPIFAAINNNSLMSGVLLRNFQPADW